jgi:predicted RNA-binding protein with PUA-like domain
MNFWLVKFAPFRNSWQDILRNSKFEIYSVRNAQACNNLKKMQINDPVLFYHSQQELAVMGLMKVIRESHQDPTTSDTHWVSVTFEPVNTFTQPITLKQIKLIPELQNIALIKQPRLSVMPLYKNEFDLFLSNLVSNDAPSLKTYKNI